MTRNSTPMYLPREMKAYFYKKKCVKMFIVTLFILKMGNNPNIKSQKNG
jgi:hypothetical protein